MELDCVKWCQVVLSGVMSLSPGVSAATEVIN